MPLFCLVVKRAKCHCWVACTTGMIKHDELKIRGRELRTALPQAGPRLAPGRWPSHHRDGATLTRDSCFAELRTSEHCTTDQF